MVMTRVWSGESITKPGIYTGVPLEAYHSQEICNGPSVSSSNLRRVLECNGGSPAHFYSEWTGNPDRTEPEQKAHHIIGRATHHLMLGEPNFARTFAIRPPEFANWTTKASREWRREAEDAGLIVLTDSDIEAIKGMSRALGAAVMVEQETGEITRVCDLLSGQIERSFFWQDEMTGLWCKARPDAMPTDSGDFVDLKTTASVQYLDLMRSTTQYAYHQQAAMVAEGSRRCAKIEMQTFTLVYIEKKPPYCVRPVILKDEDIALGAKQNRIALSLIGDCIEQGRWPGPGRERAFEYVDLQGWYRDVSESELENISRAADRDRQMGRRARR